jgi:hypothetical protein
MDRLASVDDKMWNWWWFWTVPTWIGQQASGAACSDIELSPARPAAINN